MVSLRSIPSVDALSKQLSASLPRGLAVVIARAAIDEARASLRSGVTTDATALAIEHAAMLHRSRPQRMINATGVLLHTNLGRAPLHPEAAAAAARAASSYGNVEFDLTKGERGGRGRYLGELLRVLAGAEAAHVVNNNAAALLLTLAALATGRQVPVSRGELIEIGGSYRLPELMAVSGAKLREIGTTNRTRLSDYERAIDAETGLLLKVHPSNYRVVGFSEEVDMDGLVALSKHQDVPLAYDLGSGLIDADVPWMPGPPPEWLHGEPGVRQELQRGVDLALFSGDKLLGGPQAGIIVGSGEHVETLKKHPLARALRIDGATMAALTTTAELYLDDRVPEIPFWASVMTSPADLSSRLLALGHEPLVIEDGSSLLGAGSVPGLELPSPIGRIADSGHRWQELLSSETPILTRRDKGDLIVDLRAVDPADDEAVQNALAVRH